MPKPYNLPGNDKLGREEIIKAHREGTEGQPAGDGRLGIYQRQDDVREYPSDFSPPCLAVTPEGLVLGALDQTGYNRKEAKNTSLTRERQKNRPITEKESSRRLAAAERANRGIPERACGRKGGHLRAV
ncbi:MAG: hypothetical protein Pg6C_03490 [Treponemataceae bacterium]|nr:MAG: hypothetical protein Pg6C_03490 [Treponemataceae bacterium]